MTTSEPIVLKGCAPVPLAGYLKALGVLRLVAEQADQNARGFWQDERFALRTNLTRDKLVRFFAEGYKPSPITGPWNKSSGYWNGDSAQRRTIIKKAQDLKDSRYSLFRSAITMCLQLVEELTINNLPDDAAKAEPIKRTLIASLRDQGPDDLSSWIDAVVAIVGAETSHRPSYAPLLGKGAIDARLDFAFSFVNAHVLLAECNPEERLLLSEASLFSSPCIGHVEESLGQFDPSAAGGYNSTVGVEGNSLANPLGL